MDMEQALIMLPITIFTHCGEIYIKMLCKQANIDLQSSAMLRPSPEDPQRPSLTIHYLSLNPAEWGGIISKRSRPA